MASRNKRKRGFTSPLAKKNRLSELKENEEAARCILDYYSPEKIDSDILAIDKKIEELLVKKQGIEDKRRSVSPGRVAHAERQIKNIETERRQLKENFALVAKMVNLKKQMEQAKCDIASSSVEVGYGLLR